MMGRIALIANAAIVVLLLVVGLALYLGEKASAAELRRTNDSILAQSQNETQQAVAGCTESQSWNDSILLAQSRKLTQQSQERNSELTHKMALAMTRVQMIFDVAEIGLQAEQGSDTTQAMSAWYERMAALNGPTIQNLHDPSLEQASTGHYVMFLARSVLDVFR